MANLSNPVDLLSSTNSCDISLAAISACSGGDVQHLMDNDESQPMEECDTKSDILKILDIDVSSTMMISPSLETSERAAASPMTIPGAHSDCIVSSIELKLDTNVDQSSGQDLSAVPQTSDNTHPAPQSCLNSNSLTHISSSCSSSFSSTTTSYLKADRILDSIASSIISHPKEAVTSSETRNVVAFRELITTPEKRAKAVNAAKFSNPEATNNDGKSPLASSIGPSIAGLDVAKNPFYFPTLRDLIYPPVNAVHMKEGVKQGHISPLIRDPLLDPGLVSPCSQSLASPLPPSINSVAIGEVPRSFFFTDNSDGGRSHSLQTVSNLLTAAITTEIQVSGSTVVNVVDAAAFGSPQLTLEMDCSVGQESVKQMNGTIVDSSAAATVHSACGPALSSSSNEKEVYRQLVEGRRGGGGDSAGPLPRDFLPQYTETELLLTDKVNISTSGDQDRVTAAALLAMSFVSEAALDDLQASHAENKTELIIKCGKGITYEDDPNGEGVDDVLMQLDDHMTIGKEGKHDPKHVKNLATKQLKSRPTITDVNNYRSEGDGDEVKIGTSPPVLFAAVPLLQLVAYCQQVSPE